MSDRMKVLVLAAVNGTAATFLAAKDAPWMGASMIVVNALLLPGLADAARNGGSDE